MAISTYAGTSTAWRQSCIYGAVATLTVPLFAVGLILSENEDLSSLFMFLMVASQSVVLIALVQILSAVRHPRHSSLFRSSICYLGSDLSLLLFLALLSSSPSNETIVCSVLLLFIINMFLFIDATRPSPKQIQPIVAILGGVGLLTMLGAKGMFMEQILYAVKVFIGILTLVLLAVTEIGYPIWFGIRLLRSTGTFGSSVVPVGIGVFLKSLVKITVIIWVGLAFAKAPMHNNDKTSKFDHGLDLSLDSNLTAINAYGYIGESLLALTFVYFFLRVRSTLVIPSDPSLEQTGLT